MFKLSGKHVVLRVPTPPGQSDPCVALCFHDNGQCLFVATRSGRIYQVTIAKFQCSLLEKINGTITCCQLWSPAPPPLDTSPRHSPRHTDELTALTTVQKLRHTDRLRGESTRPLLALGCSDGSLHWVVVAEEGGGESEGGSRVDSGHHSAPVSGLAPAGATLCSWCSRRAVLWSRRPHLRPLQQLAAPGTHAPLLHVSVMSDVLWAVFGDGAVMRWCMNAATGGATSGGVLVARASVGGAAVEWCHAVCVVDATMALADSGAGGGATVVATVLTDCCGRVCRTPLSDTTLPAQTCGVHLCDGAGEATARWAVAAGAAWPRLVIVQLASTGALHVLDAVSGVSAPCATASRRHATAAAAVVPISMDAGGTLVAWLLSDGVCLHQVEAPSLPAAPPALLTSFCSQPLLRLDSPTLRHALRLHGAWPRRHRARLWRHLLRLRGDQSAWQLHYDRLSRAELARVARWVAGTLQQEAAGGEGGGADDRHQPLCTQVVATLISWCRQLEGAPFVVPLAAPFCRAFSSDRLLCTELVQAVLQHWCRLWLLLAPLPPLPLLAAAERLMARHCPALLRHLRRHGATARHYCWPLLRSALAPVLPAPEWLQLWDHVLVNRPYFLLAAAVGYSVAVQRQLLAADSLAAVTAIYRQHEQTTVWHVLAIAYRISELAEKENATTQQQQDYAPPSWQCPPQFVCAPYRTSSDTSSPTPLPAPPCAAHTGAIW